jgi:DNA invertase Pin-like site-specific DNA recombinase
MVVTTRSFQPKPNQAPEDLWNNQLPIDAAWGIYARQSTPAQVLKHVQSGEMQTDELLMWLIDRGVREGKIALFDADLGVSGTLRIDQRTGLQELVARIEADAIKAVLVYQVSRLFRDETGVQYNVFANICKQHNCLLVTSDGMAFNFNNPMHLKMFRFLAEMAAEYIPQQIGLLHAARLRKARKGLYAGLGPVASGYIIDYRKDSPTFKKLIRYEPHSERVFSFFERFYALEADMSQLCRELLDLPYLFPPFDSSVDQRNVSRWKKRGVSGGGYDLTRKGLTLLLTNPVYIGWWIVQGDIISRNNHERIIDEEHEYLFWYAFNHLSEYTTDGKKNNQRDVKPRRFFQRGTAEQLGLLKHRITSPGCRVYVNVYEQRPHYSLMPEKASSALLTSFMSDIDATVIDEAFTARFFEHLKATRDFDDYRRWIREEEQKQQALATTITKQLEQITAQQEAILNEIIAIRTEINETIRQEQAADPLIDAEALKKRLEQEAELILRGLRGRYTALETPKEELSAKMPKPGENEHLATARKYADFQTELEKLVAVWESKPIKERREFVNLFVKQAVLTVVSTHWVQLDLYWSHPAWEGETLFIYRVHGARSVWTEEDRDVIRTLYPDAEKEMILVQLPHKSWAAIRKEAIGLGIQRISANFSPIPQTVTWSDWQFMQKMGIPPNEHCTKCIPLSAPTRLA